MTLSPALRLCPTAATLTDVRTDRRDVGGDGRQRDQSAYWDVRVTCAWTNDGRDFAEPIPELLY